jgi:hypothetical protein
MPCAAPIGAIAAFSVTGAETLELLQNGQGISSTPPTLPQGPPPTALSSREAQAGPTAARRCFHPRVSFQSPSHHSRCLAPALATLREAGPSIPPTP